MAKHIESYIDSSIETPKKLPSNILAMLKTLEEFDKREDVVAVVYFDKLDDLWVFVFSIITEVENLFLWGIIFYWLPI